MIFCPWICELCLIVLADNTNITNKLDDMILVRLGTSNPGRTKEEEQQWNEGLKLVLKICGKRIQRILMW